MPVGYVRESVTRKQTLYFHCKASLHCADLNRRAWPHYQLSRKSFDELRLNCHSLQNYFNRAQHSRCFGWT